MVLSTEADMAQIAAVASSSSKPALRSCSRDSAYIQAGDLIIIYASRDKTPIPLTVTPGEHVSNMFGHFPHDDMIGMPYGSKMISKNRRGYVYLLRPTPELWTLALPHRTQILYAPDMSFISMKLNMGPGSRIIEAGTGSGSFSHFIARTVGRASSVKEAGKDGPQVPRNWKGLPNHLQQGLSRGRGQPQDNEDVAEGGLDRPGSSSRSTAEPQSAPTTIDDQVDPGHGRLWSFEFHEPRADKARAEFSAHGMDKVIVLNHRNVCKDGFGLADAADAVFLDLPAPWEAVGHAAKALRRKTVTRICCFSPCIEQVLKTVSALTEHGFTDVETFESLVRTHESLAAAGPEVSIDEAIQRIQAVERRKEARRLIQIEKARNQKLQKEQGASAIRHDKSSNPSTQPLESSGEKRKFAVEEEDDEERGEKDRSPKSGDDAEAVTLSDREQVGATRNEPGVSGGIAITKKKARLWQQQSQQSKPIQAATVYSRPYYEMRGHTSYLTFATLLPRDMTD